jgi:hypothetical protein
MKNSYLLKTYWSIILMALISFSAKSQFVIDSTGITGVQNGYTEWGDYDNDGDQDLVIMGYYVSGGDNYITKIYNNNGGNFTEVYPGSIMGIQYGAARWGDFDNDGDLDLFIVGSYDATNIKVAKLYRNTGSSFTEVYPGTFTPMGFCHAAWADFNNDGLLDIIYGGFDGSTILTKLYKNTGSGFTEVYAGTITGKRDGFFAWTDFDNDGLKDFAAIGLMNNGSCQSSIFHNTGSGFTEVYLDQIYDVTSGFCAWGDYNNDGLSDLLVSGSNPDTAMVSRIYQNTGTGFTLVFKDSIAALANSSGAWGDLDNDGDLDIFITGVRLGGVRKTAVYINSGTGFHQMAGNSFTNLSSGSASLVDYDNDHDLDIFITGQSTITNYNAHLWENQVATANTPPSAPSGLTSGVVGNIVTLSWLPANDLQTAQATLTYNIYIGSVPSSVNILSPMANITNGYRKNTAVGNVWQAFDSINFIGLPVGTYYWSVQAIDNGYEGSVFAGEQTFTVLAGGIEEAVAKNPVLYPNPVTDASVIELEMTLAGMLQIEIHDMSGRMVSGYDAGVVSSGIVRVPINSSGLENGCYFASILINGHKTGQAVKLIKSR